MNKKTTICQQDIIKPLWINVLGLALIGLISLGYVLFKRDFAKLHFQLPFLGGLPLFVGEMLWITCFALMIVKFLSIKNRGMFYLWLWVAVYGIWLLSKVIFGFIHCGPLAFRHAALFYYPFFAIFGFWFFDKKVFSSKILLFLLGLIISVFAFRRYDLYWTFTLSSLAIVLILHLRSQQTRLWMLALVLLVIPYYAFFSTARMMIVANTSSLAILGVGLYKALFFKKTLKVFILMFFVLGIIASAYYSFFVKVPTRLFPNPNSVLEIYRSMDRDVQKKKDYKKVPISAQLYRPEQYDKNKIVSKAAESSGNTVVPYKDDSLQVARQDLEGVKILSVNPTQSYRLEQRNEKKIVNKAAESSGNPVVPHKDDSLQVARKDLEGVKISSVNNIIFRLFIWRDMWKEWCQNKPLWGFDFGHPLRSKSLEVLGWARNEWNGLGWVEPHNSYFHIIYRAGFLGVIFVSVILGFAIWLLLKAFMMRSLSAILLSVIVWNWIIAANFLIIFEVPYTAIPFWTLCGMTLAYLKELKDKR